MTDVALEIEDRDNPSKISTLNSWAGYEVTSDMMAAADNFSLTPNPTPANRGIFKKGGGQKVKIFAEGVLQMKGITEDDDRQTDADSRSLAVSGRDYAGLLVDNAVNPPVSLSNLTLAELAHKVLAPFADYIDTIIMDNAVNRYKVAGVAQSRRLAQNQNEQLAQQNIGSKTTKVVVDRQGVPHLVTTATPRWGTGSGGLRRNDFGKNSPVYRGVDQDKIRETYVKPGETVWALLAKHAQRLACHMWMTSDGELCIARPSYVQDSSAYGETLTQLADDDGNPAGGNVTSTGLKTSIADRYANYVVLGQGRSAKKQIGKELTNHKGTTQDPSPAFFTRKNGSLVSRLPKVTVKTVKRLQDKKLIRRLVRTMMEEGALKGFDYEIEVPRHFSPSGLLYSVDTSIPVNDKVNGIQMDMFIYKRTLTRDVEGDAATVLSLWPQHIWLAIDHDIFSDEDYLERMKELIFW